MNAWRSERRRAVAAGRILRWSLTALDGREVPGLPVHEVPHDLAARAAFHGISPLVHLALRNRSEVPEQVAASLASSYHHAVQHHLATLDGLQLVAEALGASERPWLVVKGPVLSEVVYPRVDWRSYVDLDLVVPAAGLDDAMRLLVAAGCRVHEPDWAALARWGAGEVHVLLPSGGEIDLHWHLLNDRGIRQRFAIRMGEVFERARTVTLGGRRYRTMSSTHTLLHLALHASVAGGQRLLWVKDIDQALRHDVDWDDVLLTARAWGAVPALAAQLERCRRLLRRELPAGTAPILAAARGWSRSTSCADVVAPPEVSDGRASIGRLVWRETHETTRASLEATGRTAWNRVATRARRVPAVAPVPDAGEQSRRDYLAVVASDPAQR